MTESKLPKGTFSILLLIALVSLIDGLDASIVTVALPTIAGEFGKSVASSSWVMFVYVLGIAAFLLPMGKMAKNGRVKKYIILGTALFGISSMLCGLCDHLFTESEHTYELLIAFRLIQGISAAMMSSALPSIVVRMLPVDRKGLGMSVMGAASGIALIAGPVLGGIITDFLSWGWLFYINVPVCAVIVYLGLKHLPKDGPVDPDRDPSKLGGISAMVVIGSLLVIMEDLGDPDLNLWAKVICGIIGAVGIVALIYSIRRDSKKAIISPAVVRNREYVTIGMSFLLCTVVVAGASYLLPHMLQSYWGLSAYESGLYLAAPAIAMVALVFLVGKLCDRYGCKWPAAAAVALRATFCVAMIILTISESDPIFLIPALLVFGASHAFSGTAQPTRMIHHATPGYEDESTNFMLVINYVAEALGCVVFAMVFGIFAPGGIPLERTEMDDGFIPTMIFSLVMLSIAMVCTLSVRNKIVKAEKKE